MEEFFIIKRHTAEQEIFVEEYDDPNEYGKHFASGSPINEAETKTKLFFKQKSYRKPDYLGGILSFPVVSSRFKNLLVNYDSNNLEFHTVDLICKKTDEIDSSYSFMNILNNVPCFDWEASEYEVSPLAPTVILGVNKLVVNSAATQGRPIFRMKEIRSIILVNLKLRQAIERESLTGIRFMNLDEYTK